MNFSSIGGMLRPTTTGSAKGAAGTTWDAAGNLSSQTGGSGSSAQYAYDDTGRPVRAIVRSPLMGTSVTSVRYADATSLRPSTIASPGRMRAFVYDANGNVTGLSEFGTSDATGESGFDATASGQQQTIGVRYDALNRVAGAKVYVNGAMTEDWVYFYDSTGNRETAQNLVTGWLFGDTERDAAHRVTRQNGNYREARIAYDARGRIARFTYNEKATNATGGLARLLTVNYGYSAEGRVVSRTGTVSKNGAAAAPISSDEIGQWLDNYEAGSDPVAPPANLLGWVKALQFVQEPGLEPVCVECVFYAGPRLAWTAFQLARDPIWSMLRLTGKREADAQQCAAIPEQLTLAEQMGMLKDARSIKGDFNLGEGTSADADALARDFIGLDYRTSSRDESILISKDGLRQYRPPSSKDSPYSTTGVQANFESRSVPHGEWQNNGHLNIRP
ncbi:hypothetical protein PQR75_21655 [Paraburkholderia fungorum]|uniref:hypothetical protein n=1 Tax=Paraburkholderia fungorum TaxID=134537 RepID=UPI0038B9717C